MCGEGQLVDVHSHVSPDFYVDAARSAGHRTPDAMPGWPQWTAAEHLEMMRRNGIARSVVSISSPGVHFGDDTAAAELAVQVNDYMSELHAEHPTDFDFFAALPLPDVDASIAESSRTATLPGRVGLGIETNAHGMYLGATALDPLWTVLDAEQAVVFVHPTSPPGFDPTVLGAPAPFVEFLFDTARSVIDLVRAGVPQRFPRIRFIVGHCGGVLPALMSRVELFAGAGLLPSSGELDWDTLWFDLAGAPLPDQVPALVSRFGTSRLLYGSDFCFTPEPAVTGLLKMLDAGWPIAEQPWRPLVAANAARLFEHSRPVDR
ncbi:amidohydrolase family protein [Gordonia sp. TBRC 11910]|uniref:6-methylsalicylate decarboxylase n=1 Tax=Gordonia asplenii TaxID=2725283 RepID=A0A848L8B0_9ACTN|nr:amidohydrolase family protein [Gordonia asplenii]NMO05205.1 amidohydrolase family protein [Gordonia asplenii]